MFGSDAGCAGMFSVFPSTTIPSHPPDDPISSTFAVHPLERRSASCPIAICISQVGSRREKSGVVAEKLWSEQR